MNVSVHSNIIGEPDMAIERNSDIASKGPILNIQQAQNEEREKNTVSDLKESFLAVSSDPPSVAVTEMSDSPADQPESTEGRPTHTPTPTPPQNEYYPSNITTDSSLSSTNNEQDKDYPHQQQQHTINRPETIHTPIPRQNILHRLSETYLRGTLTSIDLSQRCLQTNHARLIRLALLYNPNLKVLKLSYNNIADDGIALISSAVHNHPSLSTLDVGFNNIGDVGCYSLAVHALSDNCVLKILYLSGNVIRTKGAFALARAIGETNCGLRCLHLTANNIQESGVKALARAITESESRIQAVRMTACNLDDNSCNDNQDLANNAMGHSHQLCGPVNAVETKNYLENHGLQELFLGDTGMKSVGCLSVSNMLLTNFSLRVLSLSHNGITDSDLNLFSQSISRNKQVPIESIQLSFNELTCVGVESLMNAVWGSTSLKELKLDNNRIHDRGAQLVAVVLTSVNLETVDIGFNKLTTVGIKALMKSLAENNSLKSLTLSGNSLDTTGSKAVSYALAYNTSLQSLYLDNCTIGYTAQRHITAGVASNSCSSVSTLTGFRIGAITVTLGLPSQLEDWKNDEVLRFFRTMWERWHKENADSQMSTNTNGSCPSLPVQNGHSDNNCNGQVRTFHSVGNEIGNSTSVQEYKRTSKKRGPMEPAIVVSAAKSTYEFLADKKDRILGRRKSDQEEQSPFARNQDLILETTPSGIVRPPPIEINEHMMETDNSVISEDIYNFGQFILTSGSCYLDPGKKQQLLEWLHVHVYALNEIMRLPFDNSDLWKLHQYFSSPASPSEFLTQNETKVKRNSSIHSDPGCESKSLTSHFSTFFKGNNPSPITSTENESMTLQNRSPLHTDHQNAPPKLPKQPNSSLQRKISYRFLSNSLRISSGRKNIDAQNSTIQPPSQASPGGRRRTVSALDEACTDSPSMQPATKRAKQEARIAYFPRFRARLEVLRRNKTAQREILVLLRQLKYIESAMFKNKSVYSGSPYCGEFLPADVETILLDLL